jgi:hypothetical protein
LKTFGARPEVPGQARDESIRRHRQCGAIVLP